jgi:uncharacterized protein (TIGR03086 family)
MTAMDLIASIQDAATEFGRLVDGTRPDQLDDPTPCADFTVRDLINHVASGATMFAIAFDEGSVPDDELGALFGDVLGDDYKGVLAGAIEKAGAAFTRPGALDGNVTLPFGEFAREDALGLAVFDLMVHAWDLAAATGQELQLTEADAAIGLELAREHIVDAMRDGNTFADIVILDEESGSWAELVAYTGRQP